MQTEQNRKALRKSEQKFRRRSLNWAAAAETSILVAAVVFGFLFWQLHTEKATAGAQQDNANQLIEAWASEVVVPEDEAEEQKPVFELGDNIAILQIPSFGEDWKRVIASGVGRDVLNNPKTGIGHYPSSAELGQKGNFALAGHRQGNGSPFRNLDQLKNGDEIIVTRGEISYVYLVDDSFIVSPYETWVLNDIAGRNTISLITCHPLVTFENRLVVRGELEEIRYGDQVVEVGR